MTHISSANAQHDFEKLSALAVQDRDIVVIDRGSKEEDVALIAVSELTSLLETAHLLRSPKNAERLLNALKNAQDGGGKKMSLDELRRESGLEE